MNGNNGVNKNSRVAASGKRPNQEYPGQPYYDENGVLHFPGTQNGTPRVDPYEEEYRRQLEEFSRLSGEQAEGGVDLQFHSMNEIYGGRENGAYGAGQHKAAQKAPQKSARNAKSGNKKSSGRSGGAYRGEQLQFGSHNSGKNQGSSGGRSASKKKKGSTDPKKERRAKVDKDTKKKSHPVRTFFKTVIILLLVVFVLINLLLIRYIGMVNIRERGERTYTSASMDDKAVRNILLIGSDTRDEDQYGRTDSMILLSLNSRTKEIVMTSFMRDMYVNIVGKTLDGESIDTWDKMNAAYVYGGAELLMDTIEYNFDISVDDYVYIDFYSFVDIVNAVGGIEIEVSDEEAQGMRAPMGEQNKILGNPKGTDYLSSGGRILMNGNQALAYARLRYVGNADFERTERQREVIGKIIDKVKSSDPITIDRFAKSALSDLVTNMSKTDMLLMAYRAAFSLSYEIRSLRIPAEGDYSYGNHSGQSTLDVDLESCRELLRKEIYGE